MLTQKFAIGAFDTPYVNETAYKSILDKPAHRALALESAEQGIVLLKNGPNPALTETETATATATAPATASAHGGDDAVQTPLPIADLATKAIGLFGPLASSASTDDVVTAQVGSYVPHPTPPSPHPPPLFHLLVSLPLSLSDP